MSTEETGALDLLLGHWSFHHLLKVRGTADVARIVTMGAHSAMQSIDKALEARTDRGAFLFVERCYACGSQETAGGRFVRELDIGQLDGAG